MLFSLRLTPGMRKVIITLILLLVLEGIKRLVAWSEHPSDYFFYNLFSCLQLFLIIGLIFILITRPLLKRFIKKQLFLWQSLGYLLLILLLELGCGWLLSHPRSIPLTLFPAFKFYYDHFECRIIQYEPAYTRFDTALYYSLRGNANFIYRNREYADRFSTNSKGFRDSEASLAGPDIICLGDSYTLGWGAGEATNYPALLEAQTGLDVLNAGMSSYGTARESRLLSTLDTSQVKYVIWQYCANDDEENDFYLRNGRVLPPHTPRQLDSVMDLHAWTRRYFPGRHFFTIAKLSASRLLQSLPPIRTAPSPTDTDSSNVRRARDFLDIVAGSAVDLSKTTLIVLDLGPYPLSPGFIHQAKNLASQRGLDSSILFLDCSAILTKEDFYTLDVHLNSQGNRKIAEALARMIKAR